MSMVCRTCLEFSHYTFFHFDNLHVSYVLFNMFNDKSGTYILCIIMTSCVINLNRSFISNYMFSVVLYLDKPTVFQFKAKLF